MAALGPLLDRVPLHLLQFAIGVLLLLFGMRWLRKAALRAAGIIPLHDEAKAFATETAELREQASRRRGRASIGSPVSPASRRCCSKASRWCSSSSRSAPEAACWFRRVSARWRRASLVAGIGLAIHRPLARVPENALKLAVGVMLSSFGVFWTGEGLGVPWPGADLAIVAFAALFLIAGLGPLLLARRPRAEVVP